MAKTFKEIKAEFKQDMQKNNKKFTNDQRDNINQAKTQSKVISEQSKAVIGKPKSDYSNMTGTKFLMILWGTIASLPFLIIGLILFVIAGLFFWDAFIGL